MVSRFEKSNLFIICTDQPKKLFIKYLDFYVKKKSSIRLILLENNQFSKNDLKWIIPLFSKDKRTQTKEEKLPKFLAINLSKNKFKDKGISLLIRSKTFQNSFSWLQSLFLRRVGITIVGLRVLISYLQTNPILNELDIGENPVAECYGKYRLLYKYLMKKEEGIMDDLSFLMTKERMYDAEFLLRDFLSVNTSLLKLTVDNSGFQSSYHIVVEGILSNRSRNKPLEVAWHNLSSFETYDPQKKK